MKMLWCWCCQQEIPMLEDIELALVRQAREAGNKKNLVRLALYACL